MTNYANVIVMRVQISEEEIKKDNIVRKQVNSVINVNVINEYAAYQEIVSSYQ